MKAVATALKRAYTSAMIEKAARELGAFEEAWVASAARPCRCVVQHWKPTLQAFQILFGEERVLVNEGY